MTTENVLFRVEKKTTPEFLSRPRGLLSLPMLTGIEAVPWRIFRPAAALFTTDAMIVSIRLPRAATAI